MKHWAQNFLLLIAAAGCLSAQRIRSETADRKQIIHVQTALNHITVIELSEPVIEVAAGSPSFKVEWRENKVFVQPMEAEVSTDLFIWTATGRLSYELEPAGSVRQMDFAVVEAPLAATQPQPAVAAPPPLSPTDLLLAGKLIRAESSKGSKNPVEVIICDLYESEGRVFVRYSVQNHSTRPYSAQTPRVYALDGVRYSRSLYGLVNHQLDEDQATKLKIKEKTAVPVLEGQLQASTLDPGQQTLGVVALRWPANNQPTIFEFEFPSDGQRPIAAFLVR